MAANMEELKQKILEFATKKAAHKSKMYIKDLYKADPDAKPREIKKAANELVKEGKLEYFSSGSTVMYGVPGFGKGLEEAFEE
ncbi:Dissimilatory sulfite reductase clustered protein DsrD [Dissulfuribacter thermophilus]|uniref:Dissimilatory sulfite reductase clustered protein DsrD n=1 Tax=Dissulfuribacter thermophilus TaxID=1156395 RepID=A0A1B9F9A5_9BACT|nr:dissimilatory sulfite reductase D family protein [Dissulfuribacter thermophilus]OCC16506.1 Dissimilatory sulfite reductase clustered protein DsrD [Dissulfuribacter thermophilus]